MMKNQNLTIGLFVPCYVDQFYPQTAIAALELLESGGWNVVVPDKQTCCGQPAANSGYEEMAIPAMNHFLHTFSGCDYIVCPSGSCAHYVRHHYNRIEQTDRVRHIRNHTLELCEFITRFAPKDFIRARFPYKTGLHQSCHGQRGLRLSSSSEMVCDRYSLARDLLMQVRDLELISLDRSDECCGFGGTFSVMEEAVSASMGTDRIRDHLRNGAEIITGTDISCLMHLEGLIRRQDLPLKVMHIAEILNHN